MSTAQRVAKKAEERVLIGIRCALITALAGRFGALPARVLASIRDANEDRLFEWIDRACPAKSLSEVGIETG